MFRYFISIVDIYEWWTVARWERYAGSFSFCHNTVVIDGIIYLEWKARRSGGRKEGRKEKAGVAPRSVVWIFRSHRCTIAPVCTFWYICSHMGWPAIRCISNARLYRRLGVLFFLLFFLFFFLHGCYRVDNLGVSSLMMKSFLRKMSKRVQVMNF